MSIRSADYGKLTGKSGEVKVLARFATRDNADGTAPDFDSPREVTLYITRRDKSLPRAKGPGQFAGDILTVIVKDFVWAEYGDESYLGDDHWFNENYGMQIISLAPSQPVMQPDYEGFFDHAPPKLGRPIVGRRCDYIDKMVERSLASKPVVEIVTVTCRTCGACVAGHVVAASEASYADIGASVVDGLRRGRKVGLTTGTVRLGSCKC
jgi:hypothetical protein